ncbi:MAG: glycerol-3-phosphate dehydrogenase subunit GlpB [Haloarculaceae archaeon]
MSVDSDVLVVGGGLAGSMAALAAARADRGATVGLVSDGETTLRAASGLIDVLGYTPDGEGPLRDPFEAIPDLPTEHPYPTVGLEAVREGLALFDDVAGDAYRGGHTGLNALVPTAGGATKPTARYPTAVAPGLAARTDDMLLVGFEDSTAMDAHLVADRLQAAGVPFSTTGVTVRFPADGTAESPVPAMAAALDANEPVPDTGGEDSARSVRTALAEAIYTYHQSQGRVGLPAVLGRTEHEAIRDTIADHLDADVFEVPLGPPSIPGRRLGTLLTAALERDGVEVTDGRVTDVETTEDAVEGVVLGDGDERLEAGAFVLATGGLTGGGIRSDRTSVREPLFGCHVEAPPDRYDWFDDEFFGTHPFAHFGVRTDDQLRPLDPDGTPEFDNLRAAGAVLGGYDLAAEKSGSGVSIATGYVAGCRAAKTR